MRPTQMLDMQAELLSRLQANQQFRRFVTGVFAADCENSGMTRDEAWDSAKQRPIPYEQRAQILGEGYMMVFQRAAQRADCYRVSPEMASLAVHLARNEVNETDVWAGDLAPSPYGMVFFEEPLVLADLNGDNLHIDYVVWGDGAVVPGKTTKGTGLFMLSNNEKPDLLTKQINAQMGGSATLRKIAGRWGVAFGDVVLDGDELGQPYVVVATKDYDTRGHWVNTDGPDVQAPNPRHIVYALWTLMGQTITHHERGVIPPKMKRRFRDMRIPARVTVVTLRHTTPRGPGTENVLWHHKWYVRGHLRWQPYGKRLVDHIHHYGPAEVDNGHSTRFCTMPGCDHKVVRLYISGFLKGPADAPLIQTTKVYDLKR